ncbi:MAG: alanine--tRNA ligase-related protein, partial [Anaplasma sp.]
YQLDCNNVAIHEVVPALTQEGSASYMGDAYPELLRFEQSIVSVLRSEEEGFIDTLRRGMMLLQKEIADLSAGDMLRGDTAFKLYDTFGFPLDITLDIAKERGLKFDQAGFDENMSAQKERSRKHWVGASAGDSAHKLWGELLARHKSTCFVGYENCSTKAAVISIVQDGEIVDSVSAGGHAHVLLDLSPFSAESGGQEGDKGLLTVVSSNSDGGVAEVLYTRKALDHLHVHECVVQKGKLSVGDVVDAVVDADRRSKLKNNHSATHILHSVLRTYIDKNIQQKGSLVAEDKLRFDFNHPCALTKEQIALIEREVNGRIMSNKPVLTERCNFEQALQKGAIALFGEKYVEDSVRVVSMGDSKELCCGTHVRYTGDIGSFRVVSESGIALGVRRIEAITGQAVIDSVRREGDLLLHVSQRLGVPINQIAEGLDKLFKEKSELKKGLVGAWHEVIRGTVKTIHCGAGVVLHLGSFPTIPVDVVVDFVQRERKACDGVFVLAAASGDKTVLILGVSDAASKVLSALDLLKVLADLQGKGGGNAGLARVSLESSKIEKAFSTIQEKVQSSFPAA